ncbi:MAG: UDP kinase [Polyangiaceae bacterium]|nr:UDP kinase [Polyangiaceae bacterium]
MGLFDVVVLSAVQGAAEALPISAAGHGAAARIWLGADRGAMALEGALHLATAAALAVAVRRRLAAAIGDGVRAIARPALFRTSAGAWDAALVLVGCATSLIVGAALRPRLGAWAEGPLAQGIGLVATGAALASTALSPGAGGWRRAGRAPAEAPSMAGMMAVGLVHGLAVAPGASRVGAALVALLWLGIRPARALELSFLLSAPGLLVAGARGLGALEGTAAGAPAAGLVIAFVGASLGAAALRALVERRLTGALALWVVPLGLATIAYARALPGAV